MPSNEFQFKISRLVFSNIEHFQFPTVVSNHFYLIRSASRLKLLHCRSSRVHKQSTEFHAWFYNIFQPVKSVQSISNTIMLQRFCRTGCHWVIPGPFYWEMAAFVSFPKLPVSNWDIFNIACIHVYCMATPCVKSIIANWKCWNHVSNSSQWIKKRIVHHALFVLLIFRFKSRYVIVCSLIKSSWSYPIRFHMNS